jgi:HEAT repeat protein
MDVSPLTPPEQDKPAASVPAADPRLQPTPDFGTLGPGSDIATGVAAASTNKAGARSQAARRIGPSVAIAAGVLMALLVGNVGSALAAWNHITSLFSPHAGPDVINSSRIPTRELDREQPQAQAEALLERAVNRDDNAPDQIASRVDQWRGKLKWDSRISTLSTAALNSADMHVRTSAVEVQLAAYGLSKNDSSLDNLIVQSNSSDHARKIWALWALGLIGNRGVEAERVVEVLTEHLQSSKRDDEDSRRWAAEGLALVGTSSTIAPLLQAMHNDPSPLVRERAACSLAQSGMLTSEQRLTAVPQLLNYTDDPSLDAQTHAWAFQALADITGQRLPHDSAAWRNWYGASRTN